MESSRRAGKNVNEFEALDESVEVRGAAVQSIVDGVPDAFTGMARRYLADEGIEEVEPGEWYPQQAYLYAYQRVVEDIGESTLRQIGKSTPENAEWPPGIDTPLEGLQSIDDAYQMNHRGGEIGSYDVEVDGDSAVVYCQTPYPCGYDEALIEGTAQQFTDGYVTVTEVGDECRAEGGDECAYRVTW